MQPQHRSALPSYLVLVVSGEQEGHHRPRRASCGLDDVGNVAIATFQVEIGAIRDPLELAPTPGKVELDVRGARGVMRELFGLVLTKAHLVLRDAVLAVPVQSLNTPVLEPLGTLG